MFLLLFFFSSKRRNTRCLSDWSSAVCSSDLTYNTIYLGRVADVAAITPEEAINYNLVGPNLRGSGVNFDVRRDEPYSVYPRSEERRVGKGYSTRRWRAAVRAGYSVNLAELG